MKKSLGSLNEVCEGVGGVKSHTNKTVTTVTVIKAARNCLSLEKTNTFNCQNFNIITLAYILVYYWAVEGVECGLRRVIH